jgi:MFS transporter, DHA3 family, macrolide efflux protein
MRKFTVLWVGQIVSLFGSGLTGFALGVWVYLRTGSATQYAVIFMLAFLPGIIASPLAGTVTDRLSRWTVLLLCDVAGIACMTSLAALYSAGLLAPWHIYITTSVASVAAAFQIPAFASSVTLLVQKKDVDRANGMVMLAQAVSQVLAPLGAGVLLSAITLRGVILLDGATFVANSIALVLVRIPRPRATVAGTVGRGSMWSEWVTGWRYVTTRKSLMSLIYFYAALNFCVGFVDVLITPVVLGFASTAALGTILSIGGVGMVVGSVLMTVWGGPSRRMPVVIGFSVPLGLSLCVGALRPSLVLITAAAFAFFFCSAIINACTRSIWQVKVEPDLQGRVLSVNNMIANSVLAVAYLLSGPLADRVFDPLLRDGGRLAASAGRVIGVGPGRGTALLVLVLGSRS